MRIMYPGDVVNFCCSFGFWSRRFFIYGYQSNMLPTGTVTFVFTDIEGSTQLLQKWPEEFPAMLDAHHHLIRSAFGDHGGTEIDVTGDGFFFVFTSPLEAIKAVSSAQKELKQYPWQGGCVMKVRMGVHTGHGRISGQTYIGLDVHKTARIMSAAYGGQILISGEVARRLEEEDLEEIDISALGEFLLRDIREPELLYMVRYDGSPAEDREILLKRVEHNNLPSRATQLLGRNAEIAGVCGLLRQRETRLLTLVGPGGIGKTSLALESAKELLEDFPDGVYAVFLAPVTDPQFLPSAIAQAIGFVVNSGRPVTTQLLEHIGHQRILLILDNMEHLLAGVPTLVRLLEGSPNLKFLITSRSVLRLSWEHEYHVPPLPFVNKGNGNGEMSPSVELFIQRAQTINPNYKPSSTELQLITEICAKLDGLPLAIELAASRIKVLTLQAILSRLCNSLDLLRGGTTDLPERHQAIRHTISWSYDLLGDQEQALFRHLGVYAGGFTLEAAEETHRQLYGLRSDGLDLITALRDQSLIRLEQRRRSEPRYMMLETIREYALERLEEAGEDEDARTQHAQWYLVQAREAAVHYTGPDAREWLEKVEAELDNYRAALKWCARTGDAGTGLSLCNALWRFWVIRGFMQEGVEQLKRQLELPESSALILPRARALNALGTLLHEVSDFKGANEHLTKAIELFRQADDSEGLALTLNNLGWVAAQLGQLESGMSYTWEAFELHKSNEYQRGMGISMNNLGFIAMCKSDFTTMRKYYQEHYAYMSEIGDTRGMAYSLLCQTFGEQDTGRMQENQKKIDEAARIVNEIGDRQMVSWARTMQAYLYYHVRRFEEAKQYLYETVEEATLWQNRLVVSYELLLLGAAEIKLGNLVLAKTYLHETLGYARHRGSRFLEGLVTRSLAELCLSEGDFEECLSLIKECYQIGKLLHHQVRIVECGELLAMLWTAQQRYSEAAGLFGIIHAAREQIGIPIQASMLEEINACLDTLKTVLGTAQFEQLQQVHRSAGHIAVLDQHLSTIPAATQ